MDPVPLSPAHASLLRAALLNGADARAAYDHWRSVVRLDDVGPEEYRLLPWLARNLQALGIEDESSARLRGIARRAWYSNQLALRIVAESIAALSGASIDSRVLGGSLAMLHHQAERGPYPIDGVDLLIRAEALDRAVATLRDLQWSVVRRAGRALVLRRDDVFLALHPDKEAEESRTPSAGARDHAWLRPLVMPLADASAWLINPEGQLLEIVERRSDSPSHQPLRCLAEAAALLTSEVPMAWDDLLAEARARRAGTGLLILLQSVSDYARGGVPQEVLDELTTSIGVPEQPAPAKAPRFVWRRLNCACGSLWRSYERAASASSAAVTARGFIRYLVQHWELRSAWRLPWAIGARVWRLVRASGLD
ncbi:MAG: nucleotidyltransferase family protein [Vicinamibacterales bacterium]